MAVMRGELPFSDFTIIPNRWVRDESMSLKARGLLVYLLSHSAGYRISNAQMVRQCADGKDAVRNARDELVKLGYLVALQTRDGHGQFAENDYTLAEPARLAPRTENPPVRTGQPAGNPPRTGNPSTGNPDTENPPRRRTTGEDQQPTTSTTADADAAPQLALVPSSTPTAAEAERQDINRRANTLMREYCSRVPLTAPMGVRAIVAKAIRARTPDGDQLYTDADIRRSLSRIADRRETVTTDRLRHQLEGTTPGRPAVYREPDTPAPAADQF